MRHLAATFLVLLACGGNPDAPADLPDGAADAAIDAPADANGVRVIELGAVTSGVPIAFEIPTHTLGFQLEIAIDGADGTEMVGIETVDDPMDRHVVAGYTPVGHQAPTGASTLGIAAIAVPQATSAMPVVAGTWSASFYVQAGKTARARVLVRTTPDGEFHGGRVDLRVYIPDGLVLDGQAITAAQAAGHAGAQARLDSFFATLAATFELDRGDVVFLPLAATFATIDDEQERRAALAATTPFANGHGVHMVWTGDLTLFQTQAWGNSGSIPGAPAATPRGLAGIVVDVASSFPAAADGMTMVHELGHFLGLFHTTEGNRAIHDPLSDTPECAPAVAACPDGNNIMFVTFYGATGGVGLTASAQQRRVVWGSPFYRAQ